MWIFLVRLVLCIPLFIKYIIFYVLIMPLLMVIWLVAIFVRVNPITFVKHMINYGSYRTSNRGGNRPHLTDHVKEIIFNKKNGTEVYVPRFHALEKGPKTGPLMVFLHGFPESHLSWRKQMEKFASTYRCVVLSLPGYGQSTRTGALRDYQLASVVLQVVGAIKHLSRNGKAVVVGHDWGGMIAYGIAILHPEVVDKLVVMSSPHPLLYLVNMTLPQFWRSFYFILFQMPYLPELYFSLNKYEVVLTAASTLSADDALIMQWCFSHPDTVTPALNYYRNLFTMDYATFDTCMKKRLEMPVLVLWGSNDEYVLPNLSKGITERVASRAYVHILKGAGHFIQQEVPDIVNSHMQNFLDVFAN